MTHIFLSVCTSCALIICFSVGRPPGTLGEWYSFSVSFFLRGRELFSFGNDFTGSRGHTHVIGSSFGQQYIALDIICTIAQVYDSVQQAR